MGIWLRKTWGRSQYYILKKKILDTLKQRQEDMDTTINILSNAGQALLVVKRVNRTYCALF